MPKTKSTTGAHKSKPAVWRSPVEEWRFSNHQDPDGVQRFHCPLCRTTIAPETRPEAQEHPERRWPKTLLAQETLQLATTLAQDAWLVDELGEDGEPRLKSIVSSLHAIHRASLKGAARQDLRFVFEWVAANGPRFRHWKEIVADGIRGYSRERSDTKAERMFQIMCSQFEGAWTRSFGPVKQPARLRETLVSLTTAWGNRTGGTKGYVLAVRALWLVLRGSELDMDTLTIRKLASEFRPRRSR